MGVSAFPRGAGSVVALGPSSNGHSLEAEAGSGNRSPATTHSATRVKASSSLGPVFLNRGSKSWQGAASRSIRGGIVGLGFTPL